MVGNRETTLASQVGARLRAIRMHNGWTQQQFAERLGITAEQLSRYETGKMLPSVETLIDIVEELHIILDELLRGRRTPVVDVVLRDDLAAVERLPQVYRNMAHEYFRMLLTKATEELNGVSETAGGISPKRVRR
jgi:transcriptional regulator with XRE-family HTH domain